MMSHTPEQDRSKQAIGQGIRNRIGSFLQSQEDTQRGIRLPLFFTRKRTRREALEDIAGMSAMALVATTGIEILTHPEWMEALKIAITNPEVIPAAKELLHIIEDQPSPEDLRSKIVHRGQKIDLETERQKVITRTHGQIQTIKVRINGLGDSNFYKFGTMHDGSPPDPQDQPHSFTQVGGDTVRPHLEQFGIEEWETDTYAVPGAPSGDGYPQERRKYGLLSIEQFNNPLFQKSLKEEKTSNTLDVLVISATGDDWRALMENALALANFYSKLENIKKATKKDVEQFKELLAQSNVIAKKYGENLEKCLQQTALINREREAKGLLGVKVILAHPFNMLGVKHIPFRTLAGDDDTAKNLGDILKKVSDDPKDDRHYLDIGNIPYGNKIAYMLTVSMYQQLASSMKKIEDMYPDLQTFPLEWMGLEEVADFFFLDGHPGEKGTPIQAALFLSLFSALHSVTGEKSSLDKAAQLPSTILSIVTSILRR